MVSEAIGRWGQILEILVRATANRPLPAAEMPRPAYGSVRRDRPGSPANILTMGRHIARGNDRGVRRWPQIVTRPPAVGGRLP